MEDDRAHQLDVEGPLAEPALRSLAHGCEGLEEDLLERLAVLDALLELGRLAAQVVVRELLEVGLQARDVLSLAAQALETPAFADAQDLFEPSVGVAGHRP